jgi:hypothetical protein
MSKELDDLTAIETKKAIDGDIRANMRVSVLIPFKEWLDVSIAAVAKKNGPHKHDEVFEAMIELVASEVALLVSWCVHDRVPLEEKIDISSQMMEKYRARLVYYLILEHMERMARK